MQAVPLGLGQRERTQTKFHYETSNNEEVSKRLREEHERQAKQQARQDQLAQRELDMVREFQHQEYRRRLDLINQEDAQKKEEWRRVEILEDRIVLGNTDPSTYRIGDLSVTALDRIEALENLCNFKDGGGKLDLSTRFTKMETWLDEGGVWDETFDYLSQNPLSEWQYGGRY